MERYSKRLILASDKSNLTEFAKRQETIFQLENAKSEAFNLVGPKNNHYIRTSNKLFDLYMEEEDYDEALEIAKEIIDITKNNNDIIIQTDALLNLSMAYLKNGNISKAKELCDKYIINEENPRFPSYCLLKANIAETLNKKDEEIKYLNKAFNHSLKNNYPLEEISNILLANAIFFEKEKKYEKSYNLYMKIFQNAKGLISNMNAEERFSFLMHLEKIAFKNNNIKLAKEISNQLSISIPKVLGYKHPLNKLFVNEYDYKNFE